MDRNKHARLEGFIRFCDRGMVFCFCALIYFLPISIALNETFIALALFFYLLKRSGMYVLRLKTDTGLAAAPLARKLMALLIAFKPVPSPLNRPVAALLMVHLVSVFLSDYPHASLMGFLGKTLQSAFVYFNFVESINTRKRVRLFLVFFGLSIILTSVNGLAQHWTGQGFVRGNVFDGRISSSWRHANDMAAYLLLIVPVFFCLTFFLKTSPPSPKDERFLFHPVTRVLTAALFVVTLVCLALTYCRGAWVAFVLGMLSLGLHSRKMLIGAVVLAVVFVGGFFPSLVKERGGDMVIKNMNDVMGRNNRLGYWERATVIIKDHPWMGSGINTYSLVQQRYSVGWGGYPHNSYLQMTAETGLVGLATFLWMLGRLLWAVFRALRRAAPSGFQTLLLGAVTGFICFLLHSFVDTNLYSVQLESLFWVYMGLLWALVRLVTQEEGVME